MNGIELIEWIGAILGVLSVGFGIFGISAYVTERMKHKAQIKNAEEDKRAEEEEQMTQAQLKNTLKETLQEEVASFKKDIEVLHQNIKDIKDDLAANTEGTVTSLRDRMHCSYKYCEKQGYATPSDKANWNELYNTYRKLGGNHFKEYVDQWKNAMDSLPDHPADK